MQNKTAITKNLAHLFAAFMPKSFVRQLTDLD